MRFTGVDPKLGNVPYQTNPEPHPRGGQVSPLLSKVSLTPFRPGIATPWGLAHAV